MKSHDWHPIRYSADCPTCHPEMVTGPTWQDRVADWVEDSRALTVVGWLLVFLALAWFAGSVALR